MDASEARRLFGRIAANIEAVMRGQHASVRKLLAAFAGGGHVLIEDTPGTGKTTLAKALAASIGADFRRIQFTPDLLPADILGVSIFDQRASRFEFRPGPVFTSILLADEVNRASPRTQSALLEVMAEGQASIEGRTHPMDALFLVVATQNPVEFRGTYPLPEAQMDRFALCLALGYVDAETEVAVLTAQELEHPLAQARAVATREEVLALRARVRRVRIGDEVKHYIVELVRRTRATPQVLLGCGPRASIALVQSAKALALLEGEDFVTPEQVQELAVPVLAHRMVLEPQAKFAGTSAASLVAEILRATAAPAGWIASTCALAAAAVGIDTTRSMSYQLFGFLAALLAAAFAAAPLWRARVTARRELPRYATAGEAFEYRVVVENLGAKPIRGATLTERLRDPRPRFEEWREAREPGEERRNWFDRTQGYFRWRWLIQRRTPERPREKEIAEIPPGARWEMRMTLKPRRRGRIELEGLALGRSDPLGLVRGLIRVPLEGRVIALPKRYRLPAIALPGRRRFQQGGVTQAVSVGDSTELIGLREYRPGDPLHRIDWKSTARRGAPIVREYQDEFFERHALILDTSTGRGEDACFEEAVALAASFVYAIDTRECLLDLLFVGGEVRTYTAGRGQMRVDHMLEVLAGVAPSRPGEFAALARAVLAQRAALSSCILVLLGWDEARRGLCEALARSGLEVRALVVSEEEIHSARAIVLHPGAIEAGLARLK